MTKEDLLQNACSLTLDQETAHPFLLLSENNNKVTGSKARQRRQSLTKAFDYWKQVLCVERLVGGQCYWEVDWSGKGVFIGVALEGLCKRGKGMECGLGRNASSWSLHCTNDRYTAWHNNIEHEIAINVASPRIGVFLDQLEGTLTFYSVASEVTAIHMFTAQNLNNLLYPCFGIEQESSVKLVQLNRNFTFSI
ncbi:tripartite motif-containing protein 16-like [Engraulis encrasicolus]|uniref:tripartite motif-containing protein 16-like n=1 Tax=Engraulis encrasicolus TaxID=184585 RepID=UPI002FD65E65